MTESSQCRAEQRRVLLFTCGCLQSALVAGILYGWASIAGTLLMAPLEHGGAALSMEETTMMFGLLSSTAFFSSLLLGIVLDVFGPRTCSVLSHLVIALGCQTVSAARTFPYFTLGACMIAFGGPGIHGAIFHIGNLFPRARFLVISCLGGSVALGFNILAVFGALWEGYGIGLQPLFASYMFVVLLSTVASLVLWPDQPFQLQETHHGLHQYSNQSHPLTPANHVSDLTIGQPHTHLLEEASLNSYPPSDSHHRLDRHDAFTPSKEALKVGDFDFLDLKDRSLCHQLLSGIYFRILVVFIANSFLSTFVVASQTTEMADQNFFPSNVQHGMARTFTVVCSFGFVCSIFIGWLMDRTGLETCTAFTLALGISQHLILSLFSDNSVMMLLSFVMYSLFRQALFPVFVAGLSARMGFKYYGILSGIGFAVSGLSQLYAATLVKYVEGTCHDIILHTEEPCTQGSWKSLHMIQCSILVLLLSVPAYDRWGVQQPVPSLRGRVDSSKRAFAQSTESYGALEAFQ